LGRHHDSYHGYLKKLTGQVGQHKIDFLERELRAQQTPLRKYCETNSDIIRMSYEFSELTS